IKTEVRSLKVGESVTLDYELLPLDASHQNVLWLSSDEGVATVAQGGTVQGIAEGEVVISILSDDGERIDQIRLKIK
ncbi:MAG: Ig-like domain-containing protein, partial [Turicibacter sp.]|nr:Ig-like domain-containing protein [Turicibacter sp.]